MEIRHGNKTYPVSSILDAQRKWCAFRDEAMAGVSEIGNGLMVYENGEPIARVSYNGRAWNMDGTPID